MDTQIRSMLLSLGFRWRRAVAASPTLNWPKSHFENMLQGEVLLGMGGWRRARSDRTRLLLLPHLAGGKPQHTMYNKHTPYGIA
jgi:hypothetical protein